MPMLAMARAQRFAIRSGGYPTREHRRGTKMIPTTQIVWSRQRYGGSHSMLQARWADPSRCRAYKSCCLMRMSQAVRCGDYFTVEANLGVWRKGLRSRFRGAQLEACPGGAHRSLRRNCAKATNLIRYCQNDSRPACERSLGRSRRCRREYLHCGILPR